MPENVHELWTIHERGCSCLAFTDDARRIFVGCEDGSLCCFDREGYLLWKAHSSCEVQYLALSDVSERVLVAGRNGVIELWNFQGHFLCQFQINATIEALAFSAMAHRIAVGTPEGMLLYYTANGTLLWRRDCDGGMRGLSLSPDGRLIVCGTAKHLSLFDAQGRECWRFAMQVTVLGATLLDGSPGLIVAGTADGSLSFLNRSGVLLSTSPGLVTWLALPLPGQCVIAGTDKSLYYFNLIGDMCWYYEAPASISSVATTSDGRFILVGTYGRGAILLDAFIPMNAVRRDEIIRPLSSANAVEKVSDTLWEQQTPTFIRAALVTPGGHVFAIVEQDERITFYGKSGREHRDVMYALIAGVRQVARANAYEGIAAWIDAFDQNLQLCHFAHCRALLQEIQEGGYLIYEREQTALVSREGALLLFEGFSSHMRGDQDQAQAAYKQSRAIFAGLGLLQSEGIAIAALHLLEQDGGDEALLNLIAQPLEVQDNGETLLSKRFEFVEEMALQLILAARRRGYLAALFVALLVPTIQAMAATALTWLQPGPSIGDILPMLAHPLWQVRWQASLLLMRYVERQGQTFVQEHPSIREALQACLRREQDPFPRRVQALLIEKIGDPSYAQGVQAWVHDPDPEVRIACLKALEKIGTAQTLFALLDIEDGQGLGQERISVVLNQTREQIGKRLPAPRIHDVACYREVASGQYTTRPASRFFSRDRNIVCVAHIAFAIPDTHVVYIIKAGNRMLWKQKWSLAQIPLLREETDFGRRQVERSVGQDKDEGPLTEVRVTLTAPQGNWPVGASTLTLALNGKNIVYTLKILKSVRVKRVVLYRALNTRKEPVEEATVFAADSHIYSVIFIEDAPLEAVLYVRLYLVEQAGGVGFFSRLSGERTGRQTKSSFVSEQIIKVQAEGEHKIALDWHVKNSGAYAITVA